MDDPTFHERLSKHPRFLAVRNSLANLNLDQTSLITTNSPLNTAQYTPDVITQPTLDLTPASEPLVPHWKRIADLKTVPRTIMSRPTIVRTKGSQFAMGALDQDAIKHKRLPFHTSVNFDWGSERFDPGVSINLNFGKSSKTWNQPWESKLARTVRFKARTGQKVSGDAWMLENFRGSVIPHPDSEFTINDCSVNGLTPLRSDINAAGGNIVGVGMTISKPVITKTNFLTDFEEFLEEMKTVGRSGDEQDLVTKFFKSEELDLEVFFKSDDKPADQFVNQDLFRFYEMTAIHLPPLSMYCEPVDEECSRWVDVGIGLDLPNVNDFQDGVLCKPWAKDQLDRIAAGADPSELNRDIRQLPFARNFPDMRSLRICLSVAAVREHQASLATQRVYMARKVEITAVKASVWPGSTNQVFYFVVTMPKDLQDHRAPEENQAFEIVSNERFGIGRSVFGVVKKWTPQDKERHGLGNFLISAALSASRFSPAINAANDWTSITQANKFVATITPVIDNTSATRVLDAIKDFTQEKSSTPNIVQMAYLNGNPGYNQKLDITVGPISVGFEDADTTKDISKEGLRNACLYNLAVKVFKRGAREVCEEQDRILARAKDVRDETIVIQGCPGSGKTTITSIMAFLLLLVGHKILVAAKINNVVDHYCKEMADRKDDFLELAENMRDDNTELDPLEKAMLTILIERARGLKIGRFIPLDQETKLLQSNAVVWAKNGLLDTSVTPGNLTKEIEEHMVNLALSRMEAEAMILEAEKCGDENRLKASHKILQQAELAEAEFELTYSRLPVTAQRKYVYPVEHSMLHHIKGAEVAPTTVQQSGTRQLTPLQQAVHNFREAEGAVRDHSQHSKRTVHELKTAEATARMKMYGAAIGQYDMIVTTCINASHPLVKASFKPTGAILEDAQTVDSGTALCLWTYPTEWRMATGDVNQSEPYHAASATIEVRNLANLSDLDAWITRDFKVDALLEQKRAIQDIMEFVNNEFFGEEMMSGDNVKGMHEDLVAKLAQSVVSDIHVPYPGLNIDANGHYYAVNVEGKGQTPVGSTLQINVAEASVITEHAIKLVRKGITPQQITVIFYYLDQMDMFRTWLEYDQYAELRGILMYSVDRYLGESNDIILVATTATVHYADEQSRRPLLSPFCTKRSRLCVALSRARFFCMIYGNWVDIVKQFRDINTQHAQWRTLYSLVVDAWQRGRLLNTSVWKPEDVQKMVSSGIITATRAPTNLDYAVRRLQDADLARRVLQASTIGYAGPEQGTAVGKYSFDAQRMLSKVKKRSVKSDHARAGS